MITIVILGIFLILWLWILFFQHFWNKNLSLHLMFDRTETYAGQKASLFMQVENKKKMPLPILEVRFSLKRGLSMEGIDNINVSDFIYKRDIFSMLGMQRITRKMDFACKMRGYYEIHEVELTAFSLLFDRHCTGRLPQKASLYVYPKNVNVENILKVSNRMSGEIQREKSFCEDPFAFRGIREYTTLDPEKYINWKASAKTGQLMVNTFDSSLQGKFMVYLDISDNGIYTYEYLTEEGISVASSLIQQFIKGGLAAGLSVNDGNSGTSFPPESGRFQTVKILRHLAGYEKKQGTCPLSLILNEPPKDTVCLVISKNRDALQDILNLSRKNTALIWVYITPAEETWEVPKTKEVEIIVRKVEKE